MEKWISLKLFLNKHMKLKRRLVKETFRLISVLHWVNKDQVVMLNDRSVPYIDYHVHVCSVLHDKLLSKYL